MKKLLGICAALAVTLSLVAAVSVGDNYQKVVQEKGQPSGKIEAGGTLVLQYPDQTIKLKGGRVVSIDVPPPRPAAVAATAPPAAPAKAKTASAPAGHAGWTTDYAAALAKAKEQNKRVFLFFTGSDWCGWCMRLQKEILSTPEFARYAQEKLVLVELDFPQKVRQSPEVKSQNASLAKRYGIRGYPSVVVLDGSGKQVGELGYQEGGPGPFVQKLSRM